MDKYEKRLKKMKKRLEKEIDLNSDLKAAGLDKDIRWLYVDCVADFCIELEDKLLECIKDQLNKLNFKK